MRISAARSVVAVLLCGSVATGAVVACGGDDPSTAVTGDAGGTTDSATGSGSSGRDAGDSRDATTGGGSDAQTPLDAATDAAADAADATPLDAAPPPLAGRNGNLRFQIQHNNAAFYETDVSASFAQAGTYDDAGSVGIPECTNQAVGAACVFTVCAPTPDGGTPPTYVLAGAITLTGGSAFPAGGIVLTPQNHYHVSSFTTMFDASGPTATPGDILTFTATGDPGAVGPFSVAVTTPPDVPITAPVITDIMAGGTTSFPRSHDLVVSWSPTPKGILVYVSVMTTVSAPDIVQKSVFCGWDGSSGTGTVPSAGGLAKLDVADGDGGHGELGFFTESTATTTAGQAGGSPGARDAWLITAVAQGTIFDSTFTTTD